MGDMADDFRAMRDHRRMQRERLGVECPDCIAREPKRNPTILMPGQRCYCGYKDRRDRQDGQTGDVEWVNCPTCGRSVKRRGVVMHHLAKHGTVLLEIPK